jgi:hypothetical protein
MKTKNLLLIAIAVLSLFGCKYDDDAIWDAVKNQEERLINLETWQKQASEEIALLKAITDESDYILSVVPVMEGETQKGYTITFKKSGTITLLNGQKGDKGDKGDTPLISLKQEKDGNWYWTLNGSLMTDASGAPIRANGANGTNGTNGTPAPTPQLKTGRQLKVDSVAGTWQDDAFYLSVDNGKTWNKVSGDKGDKGDKGDAGTGSSISIDDSNNGYVIFNVGDKDIKVPCYNAALSLVITDPDDQIVEDEYMGSIAYGQTANFTYSGLNSGSTIVVIAPTGWSATLDRAKSRINITSPSKSDCSSHPEWAGPVETIILVSDGSGMNALPIRTIASDYLYCNADNLEAMLKKYPDVKNLKVSGTLTSEHMDKIKELNSLEEIDLEDATLEEIPYTQFEGKGSLRTVKLPKGLKKIGANAFQDCSALSDITIGDQVTDLLNYAFLGCSSLTSINVPGSVKNIGESAFRNCIGLSTITIEEGLVNIGPNAFWGCKSITKITLPSTVKKMQPNIFLKCSSLGELRCLATTPPEFVDLGDIGDALGSGLPKVKITVPSGCVDTYKNANGWKQYSNDIEAMPPS